MSIFHDPASLMHQARKQLQEKTLTPAETKKKEEIVKSMKSSASDFEKRYPGRGKEVMYATATKQAKKVAEDTENIDEKVGLSIVSAGEPKYDRNEQGEVKINPANVLRFAGKKLSKAAGVKKKIRIRIGEEVGEIEEVMKMKHFMAARKKRERSEKEKELSPTRRAGIHTPEKKPERDARRDAAYGETGHGGALRAKKVRKAKALGELGEAIIGGSAPNVPAGVAKFVDELPQKVTSAAKKVKKVVTGEEIEIEVINHLIENGFAETEENAQKIMDNMSESWAEEILSELSLGQIGGAVEKAADRYVKPNLERIGAQKGREKAGPFGNIPGVGDLAAQAGRRTASSLYDQGKDAIKKGDVNTAIKTGRTALDMLRNSYEHGVYGDDLSELNRLEREQGKESGGNPDKAYQHVAKMMRSMSGKPEGQRKKVPGKKPPKAGEYGSGKRSPEQEVQLRRAQRKRSQDNMSSARD